MSSGRRRGKGGHGAEFHLDERWMTSYADMITVLMCLFIVLYAMSTVNSHKFDVLKNSLASGFGVTNSKKVDLSKGVPVPKELVDKNGAGFTAGTTAMELELTKSLAKEIAAAIKKAGGRATVKATNRGVVVGLVGSSSYFDGNRASLRPDAVTVLRAMSPVVQRGSEQITVEGHADPHGSSGPYATDWDLASARATTVLKYFVDAGLQPKRISAVSYGSARSTSAPTAASQEHNRRVDIVLHTRSTTTVPTTSAAAAAKAPATPAPTSTAVAEGH